MKIGYVCTNYNNSGFTRAAIASLLGGTRPGDVRIVVVDNKSSDADVAGLRAIEREFAAVDMLLNPTNDGYFPGLNAGIARLRTAHPAIEHVVIGNNDLVFPDDFVETLERHRDVLDAWAVVAPDIVRADGFHQNPHVLHPIGAFRRLMWDVYYLSRSTAFAIKHAARLSKRVTAREEMHVSHALHYTAGPIEQGFGACYILGPMFFQHFTKLHAPTFLMHEEFFLTEQVRTIGQSVYFDPRFKVHHHDHATTDRLPSRRRWEMARDAHRVYKGYVAMSAAERRARIVGDSGRAS